MLPELSSRWAMFGDHAIEMPVSVMQRVNVSRFTNFATCNWLVCGNKSPGSGYH